MVPIAISYHFHFTGHEWRQATIVIQDKTIRVEDGRVGEADLHVTADANTWIGILQKEKSMLWALLRRRVRLRGR